jgi:hypothetical protein
MYSKCHLYQSSSRALPVEGLYCKRPIQWRLPKYWPPTPSQPGECVSPLLWCGGHTRWGERGWGVNSSEDARHCSVLYICKYFVALTQAHIFRIIFGIFEVAWICPLLCILHIFIFFARRYTDISLFSSRAGDCGGERLLLWHAPLQQEWAEPAQPGSLGTAPAPPPSLLL